MCMVVPNLISLGIFMLLRKKMYNIRGGSRISEKGVQMYKRGVRLPNFKQIFLKFSMKMKKIWFQRGVRANPLNPL